MKCVQDQTNKIYFLLSVFLLALHIEFIATGNFCFNGNNRDYVSNFLYLVLALIIYEVPNKPFLIQFIDLAGI